MENSNTIQTELQSLSPVMATLGKGNLYALPEGYFDELQGNLLRLARVSGINNSNNKVSTADIPEGYFDQLAGNILNKIKAQKSDSSLPTEVEISADLAALKNRETYRLPEGYFEMLTGKVVKRLEVTDNDVIGETNAISGLVGSLEKDNVYSVPVGYFDNLVNQLQTKVSPAAKVVPISRFKSYFKYAAAAVFIGAISLGVLKYNSTEKSVYTAQLEPAIVKGIKMDDKKFDETLNTLSQDDILQYLEKNSSDEDVAALTSDLEDKTLPAEDDYLVDEKTLDKFIEAINTKN